MANLQTLAIPAGADADWQFTAVDDRGAAIAFSGTETLTGQVWAGDDQPVLFTPTVTFISAAAGTLLFSVAAAQTAALDPGSYRLRVLIGSGGRTFIADVGWLELTASPGTATTVPVYCAHKDLRDLAPRLDILQDADASIEGFADARGQARVWFDSNILAKFRGAGMSTLGPGGYQFNRWNGPWRNGISNQYLRDGLAAGWLMVRDQVTRCNAHYAIALVCQGQIGALKSQEVYWTLARYHFAQAEELLKSLIVELDSDADGLPNFAIQLGTTDSLYG